MDEIEIEHLIAFLPDGLRECGKDVAEIIGGIGNFETSIEDEKRLVFKVEGLPIAEIEYWEENFWVRYRHNEGDMKSVSGAIYNPDVYNTNKKRIIQLVSGAYRRWGSNILQVSKVFVELENRFPEMKDFFEITRKITTHFWMYGEKELSPDCIAALRAASEVIAEKCKILGLSPVKTQKILDEI